MRRFLMFLVMVFWQSALLGDSTSLIRQEWLVDGVVREALVHLPAKEVERAPVVLVFHGHGGNMRHAARSFAMEKWWPEAVVIYPQGLNTPGRLTDAEGRRAGWQPMVGDQGDRDLKFFDVLMKHLQQKKVGDLRKVFVTGHSNGAAFTYLLWAERGEQIRAVAPSAAVLPGGAKKLKPKPVMHIAGENDPLVLYRWQWAMMQHLLRLNEADPGGVVWKGHPQARMHASKLRLPTLLMVHPGGHQLLQDAPPLMVQFFQFCLNQESK